MRLARLGYGNVRVLCADGSLGWPGPALFDAVVVAAGGPKAPSALLAQLAPGGRLVMPIGPDQSSQSLVRITRDASGGYHEEPLEDVRFVPLIGEHGFPDTSIRVVHSAGPTRGRPSIAKLVRETAEPIGEIEGANVDALVERVADARLVLLGEATHGTSEFYRMRARISRELISRCGFQFVAVEADWPDAARVDDYVLGAPRRSTLEFAPFARFPIWMWRNREVLDFVSWLRAHNEQRPEQKVGFHGLDLYSLFTSIAAVLAYLDQVDPEAAAVARRRYGSLTPWQKDPVAYGKAVLTGHYESCEPAVVAMLRDLLQRRFEYARRDGHRFFDAAQNARLVANAERYYRTMYYGASESWNLRDRHMFDTLQSLLEHYGPNAKGIVWEHNSHVGDASATEMSARGEYNLGQLCRKVFTGSTYIVGFGTDHGTVAAASNWDEPMQTMHVRPAHEASYEALFHSCELPAFTLHLRDPVRRAVRDELLSERLERAIGVIYRPDSELASHYFEASLARQFDEYIWLDATSAVHRLFAGSSPEQHDLPDTYPFGL